MSNAGEPVAPDALGVAAVVVLAAGEGKRMKSALPKVLHRIGGRSLLGHVVAASRTLAPEHLVVVVGHGRDQVVPALATDDPAASTVVQHEQNGTGHAVRIALADLPDLDGVVVVLPGDAPLLTPATLAALVAEHAGVGRPGGPNAATVLSAIVPDPTGYGRIVRAPDGLVTGIVEHRDATPEQRAIAEINSGMYAFDAVLLRDALSRLTTDNAQGEEYLTDVLGILRGDGRPVGAFPAADWQETLGCNDRLQLADLGRRLNTRVLESAMADGVTIVDPGSVRLDVTVTWERDSTLLPGVRLHGSTSVATGAVVGPDCTLTDTSVGAGAVVRSTTADGAEIGPGADVGPYTYLRPGTRLGAKAKAGGFVEMKNAEVGAGSKVPHLSYVGDATIGERTNIGAATVFVNYDGVRKHHTVVGDDVRVGSDSMLVGPVHIGDGAYTAAGSVITEDVPPGAMAVARSRQRNVEGWVERRRPGSPAAEAAARARDAGQSGGGDQSAPGAPTAEGQS